jgi:hypothetical protein
MSAVESVCSHVRKEACTAGVDAKLGHDGAGDAICTEMKRSCSCFHPSEQRWKQCPAPPPKSFRWDGVGEVTGNLIERGKATSDSGIVIYPNMIEKVISGDSTVLMVESLAHGFTINSMVTFSSISGMVELNGNPYTITAVTADTFTINADATNFSPFLKADQHTVQLADGNFGAPGIAGFFDGHLISVEKIISDVQGKVKRLSDDLTRLLDNVSRAAHGIVTTSVPHGFSTGDIVAFENVLGMTELNGRTFKVANATDNSFKLQANDVDSNYIDTRDYGEWKRYMTTSETRSIIRYSATKIVTLNYPFSFTPDSEAPYTIKARPHVHMQDDESNHPVCGWDVVGFDKQL